ncbi:GNAT family N-acetyltransferase [Periweissella cryptocerci]|nr:GNAT family N-acetyltransferase [Periweissella cryptocerci]
MIEKLTKTDYAELFALIKYAFHKVPTGGETAFNFFAEHSLNYSFKSDGKISSDVIVTPFDVDFWGTTYKATGIGYVASYPETRGNGGIRELMARILDDEYADGVVISYLAPFSYGFYRRFGYEQIFNHMQLTWAASDFPHGAKTAGDIKRLSFDEAQPLMAAVYRDNPEMHRGALKRASWWWQYWYGKKLAGLNFAIYFDDAGQPQGYVIYNFDGMNFNIKEWVNTTMAAQNATTRFIQSHAGAFDTFTYVSPQSDATKIRVLQQMPEPNRAKAELVPDMQARIVNLVEFLNQYPVRNYVSRSFVMAVHDDNATWNDGAFAVAENWQTQKLATPPAEAEVDFSTDIQALTQWLMGYRTFAELVFAGRITVAEDLDVAEFDRLVQIEKPILADYF